MDAQPHETNFVRQYYLPTNCNHAMDRYLIQSLGGITGLTFLMRLRVIS
ncbi:hypothetical protein GWZ95_09085 [Escherichia coli]|nr:hypothetical protein [Escherichia coli]